MDESLRKALAARKARHLKKETKVEAKPQKETTSGDWPPSPEEVKKWLKYYPETGEFEWLIRPTNSFKKGRWFGAKRSQGAYMGIKWPGKRSIKCHRLAFVIMKGYWPKAVDHINGDKEDNRWCNLREADAVLNGRNLPLQHNNTSGYPGVFKVNKRWRVLLRMEGKRVHIGYFKTLEEAAIARKEADKKYGFHENHGRS